LYIGIEGAYSLDIYMHGQEARFKRAFLKLNMVKVMVFEPRICAISRKMGMCDKYIAHLLCA